MTQPVIAGQLTEMPKHSVEAFMALYEKLLAGPSKIGDWSAVQSPDPSLLIEYETLPNPMDTSASLKKLVVLKLNGGLGTGMGCRGPKSGIVVKNGKTFLQLIGEQIHNLQSQAPVPLALMNSFYTHEATQEMVRDLEKEIPLTLFQQSRFPRLYSDSRKPVPADKLGQEAWYPPGHGDIYSCLMAQGLLDKWLEEGKEVLFVSNADNLGAEVDFRILKYMLDKDIPFLMELTPKTPADVKGGTVYQQEGQLRLLEIANVPDEHVSEFQGMDKFRVFNTNNIWINLRHLKARLTQGPLDLGVIINNKIVDGQPVIQLETAIGAGLENFPGAVGLVVPRTRFAPVKTTSDLLRVQSDLYSEEDGRVMLNGGGAGSNLPDIRLGEAFRSIEDYQRRLPRIPGLSGLESLEVEGDVIFEGNATLRGKVVLKGNRGPLVIPHGTLLDNEVLES